MRGRGVDREGRERATLEQRAGEGGRSPRDAGSIAMSRNEMHEMKNPHLKDEGADRQPRDEAHDARRSLIFQAYLSELAPFHQRQRWRTVAGASTGRSLGSSG